MVTAKPTPQRNPIVERALQQGFHSGGTIGNVSGGTGQAVKVVSSSNPNNTTEQEKTVSTTVNLFTTPTNGKATITPADKATSQRALLLAALSNAEGASKGFKALAAQRAFEESNKLTAKTQAQVNFGKLTITGEVSPTYVSKFKKVGELTAQSSGNSILPNTPILGYEYANKRFSDLTPQEKADYEKSMYESNMVLSVGKYTIRTQASEANALNYSSTGVGRDAKGNLIYTPRETWRGELAESFPAKVARGAYKTAQLSNPFSPMAYGVSQIKQGKNPNPIMDTDIHTFALTSAAMGAAYASPFIANTLGGLFVWQTSSSLNTAFRNPTKGNIVEAGGNVLMLGLPIALNKLSTTTVEYYVPSNRPPFQERSELVNVAKIKQGSDPLNFIYTRMQVKQMTRGQNAPRVSVIEGAVKKSIFGITYSSYPIKTTQVGKSFSGLIQMGKSDLFFKKTDSGNLLVKTLRKDTMPGFFSREFNRVFLGNRYYEKPLVKDTMVYKYIPEKFSAQGLTTWQNKQVNSFDKLTSENKVSNRRNLLSYKVYGAFGESKTLSGSYTTVKKVNAIGYTKLVQRDLSGLQIKTYAEKGFLSKEYNPTDIQYSYNPIYEGSEAVRGIRIGFSNNEKVAIPFSYSIERAPLITSRVSTNRQYLVYSSSTKFTPFAQISKSFNAFKADYYNQLFKMGGSVTILPFEATVSKSIGKNVNIFSSIPKLKAQQFNTEFALGSKNAEQIIPPSIGIIPAFKVSTKANTISNFSPKYETRSYSNYDIMVTPKADTRIRQDINPININIPSIISPTITPTKQYTITEQITQQITQTETPTPTPTGGGYTDYIITPPIPIPPSTLIPFGGFSDYPTRRKRKKIKRARVKYQPSLIGVDLKIPRRYTKQWYTGVNVRGL